MQYPNFKQNYHFHELKNLPNKFFIKPNDYLTDQKLLNKLLFEFSYVHLFYVIIVAISLFQKMLTNLSGEEHYDLTKEFMNAQINAMKYTIFTFPVLFTPISPTVETMAVILFHLIIIDIQVLLIDQIFQSDQLTIMVLAIYIVTQPPFSVSTLLMDKLFKMIKQFNGEKLSKNLPFYLISEYIWSLYAYYIVKKNYICMATVWDMRAQEFYELKYTVFNTQPTKLIYDECVLENILSKFFTKQDQIIQKYEFIIRQRKRVIGRRTKSFMIHAKNGWKLKEKQ